MIKKVNNIAIIWLFSCASLFSQVDRAKMPEPAPAARICIGEAAKFELSNGLKVFVVENHRIPKISYSISLIFDPELEGNNAGIGDLAGNLIGTGTTTRTKAQIDEEIDFIGAGLSARADGIFASSLKKHTEKLLEILSDVTINSEFKQEELENKRKQILAGLESDKDDPNAIASNVFDALVFSKNHPYGEFETEKSVNNVTIEMCSNYYHKYFRPNIAYLTVIGDVTPDEAKLLIEKYFGNWQRREVENKQYPIPQAPENRKVAIVDRPQSVQSVIQLGYPVDLNVSDPDYIKARVTNTILGGGEFRLFLNLREKHAYTYGAYSGFNIRPLISCFKITASVRNAVTDSSINEIIYEMNRLRDEPVSLSELNIVKNYLTGNFALSLENPQTIASFSVNIERYKLAKDYYINYLTNLSAVTAQDVQQMALKYIKPDQSILLVVGKSSDIAEKVAKFSSTGKTETYDIEANIYDPALKTKNIPSGITAEKVLETYISAIGGVQMINKVKDLTINAKLNIEGNLLDFNLKYKLPDKFLSEVIMNGQIFQKEVLNGDFAKVWDMHGSHEITGNEHEKIIIDADPFPELHYGNLGYISKLYDISEVDSSKAYRLEIMSPLGNSSIDYFSVESGLKIRSVSAENSSNGQITQTTDYLDYIEVDGIKFPKKMTQRMGSQFIDITIESIYINKGIDDEIFKLN